MNPYTIRYINYINGRIYTAILTAAEIKYTALYKMAVQAFRGKVVGLRVFQVITEVA